MANQAVEKTNALTVIERARQAVGLATLENDLKALASKNADITEISTTDDYQLVHRARMDLKNQRIDIEKRGKEARDDANAFSKAVIAEEKRLIGIIQPEEDRLQKLQKDHDEKAERERQAKIDAELKRVETHQANIADIRSAFDSAVSGIGMPPADKVDAIIDALDAIIVDESFEEFEQQAAEAKAATLTKLRELHKNAVEQEAEQERIRQERAELEKLRAEQAEREAKERAAREAKEAEERKKREAAEKAEREKMAAERKAQESERKQLAEAQAKLEADRRAIEEQQERERKAKEQAERDEAERKRKAEAAARKAQFPGIDAIVGALSAHFGVSTEVAKKWVNEISKQQKAA